MITDEEIEKLAANNHSYEAAFQQNKVSDVSAEKIINSIYKRHKIDLRNPKFDIAKVNEMIYDALEEYASIVNERKETTPKDFKKVTGHDSPKEMAAYEKGREDEQKVMMDWIEKWEGGRNSGMGALLNKKFLELKERDNVVVNDWKSVIKNRIDYFNDRYHYHEANRLSDALININELIPPSDFESQPQKEEVNEDHDFKRSLTGNSNTLTTD